MKTLTLLFFLTLNITVYCQQKGAFISFEKETHNFGKIQEAKGPVSYVYNFTNTGSEPLFIQSVQPSCGCTTPEWSQKPVVPGGKGFIKATFDPAGRPGNFNKTIAINSNATNNNVILRFSGEVTASEPDITAKYPFNIDNLRFNSTYAAFGKISPGKPASKTLEVYNSGTTPLSLSFPSNPAHTEVMTSPSTIKPKQSATITIHYDAKKKNDWGFVSDEIFYTMNGKKDGKYRINLSASIEDDYSQATPQQLTNAPRLTLEKNVFDIGRVKAGTNVQIVYRFKNMGKTNLEIHKVLPSCGCTNVKIKEKTIKPGASGEVTGVFNSAGQKGAVNKTITLITNDPKSLNLVLWIRGTVE